MKMSIYPDDWPRCLCCGDFALDGHFTCGRATCDESAARDRENDEWRRLNRLPEVSRASHYS
jgi:hypothetical protein